MTTVLTGLKRSSPSTVQWSWLKPKPSSVRSNLASKSIPHCCCCSVSSSDRLTVGDSFPCSLSHLHLSFLPDQCVIFLFPNPGMQSLCLSLTLLLPFLPLCFSPLNSGNKIPCLSFPPDFCLSLSRSLFLRLCPYL